MGSVFALAWALDTRQVDLLQSARLEDEAIAVLDAAQVRQLCTVLIIAAHASFTSGQLDGERMSNLAFINEDNRRLRQPW